MFIWKLCSNACFRFRLHLHCVVLKEIHTKKIELEGIDINIILNWCFYHLDTKLWVTNDCNLGFRYEINSLKTTSWYRINWKFFSFYHEMFAQYHNQCSSISQVSLKKAFKNKNKSQI